MKKLLKNIGEFYNKLPFVGLMYKKDNTRQKYFFMLFAIIVGYIYLIIKGVPDGEEHAPVCLIKIVTGYPCPSCGTTRASMFFVHGYFKESILMNPLGALTVIASIITFTWVTIDLIKRQETFFPFVNRKMPSWFIILAILFTIANEIWNLYKGN